MTRILLTGATDGIGRAAALALAYKGAELIVHGRDAARLESVAAQIERTAGRRPATLLLDLADLPAVRAAALPDVDVLVNNAGIGAGPRGGARETTPEGTELRMAVNFVAPFVMTEAWLAGRRDACVVNVGSLGQAPIDWDDVDAVRGYDGLTQYARSKLALHAWTFELARRRPDVKVNAIHPGSLLDTKMVRETFGTPRGPVSVGSMALIALIEKTVAGESGGFYDGLRAARANALAYEVEEQARVVELGRRLGAR